jgi:hypothetical protein
MKLIRTIESTIVIVTGVAALTLSLQVEDVFNKTVLTSMSIAMTIFGFIKLKERKK